MSTLSARQKSEELVKQIEPFLDDMLTAARRYVNCWHEASDVVQETLVALCREGSLPTHLKPWLLCAVRHRALQHLRSKKRRQKHEACAACRRSELSSQDDPEQILERAQIRAHLMEAVSQLSDEQREVFILRELDELAYEDIADRLKVPVGTVRSRLNRSRLALQELLRSAEG